MILAMIGRNPRRPNPSVGPVLHRLVLALALLAALSAGLDAATSRKPKRGMAKPVNIIVDRDPPQSADRTADIVQRLIRGYPNHVVGVENNAVVFKDGTRQTFDDGIANKPFDAWMAAPDIEDMFRIPYHASTAVIPPSINVDPGRARNEAFLTKIYGDCRTRGFANSLVPVVWLPKKAKQIVYVSKRNGMAARLKAVSAELDALPDTFNVYLAPSAGTYNCRVVAGTKSLSAHAYGIAIDIALKRAHYWQWNEPGLKSGAPIAFRNAIPPEVVAAFEKHGFIWGGRWYHYDTMHFEYRPELLPPQQPLPQKK